jgi:hypothetical protein
MNCHMGVSYVHAKGAVRSTPSGYGTSEHSGSTSETVRMWNSSPGRSGAWRGLGLLTRR